jgi:hypothetical protein
MREYLLFLELTQPMDLRMMRHLIAALGQGRD